MPFGLRNAGQTFQRFMDQVLAGVPHVFVYLDDLLVANETASQCKKDVRAILDQLQKHRRFINRESASSGPRR